MGKRGTSECEWDGESEKEDNNIFFLKNIFKRQVLKINRTW